MGLAIKRYRYSYCTLQRLRQLALYYEGITIPIRNFYFQTAITTKFREFIIHSDCEGIYISKSSKQYKKLKRQIKNRYGTLVCFFGDLDKLKEEVQELNNYILKNTSGYLQDAWVAFYDDVMSSRKILEFH